MPTRIISAACSSQLSLLPFSDGVLRTELRSFSDVRAPPAMLRRSASSNMASMCLLTSKVDMPEKDFFCLAMVLGSGECRGVFREENEEE